MFRHAYNNARHIASRITPPFFAAPRWASGGFGDIILYI